MTWIWSSHDCQRRVKICGAASAHNCRACCVCWWTQWCVMLVLCNLSRLTWSHVCWAVSCFYILTWSSFLKPMHLFQEINGITAALAEELFHKGLPLSWPLTSYLSSRVSTTGLTFNETSSLVSPCVAVQLEFCDALRQSYFSNWTKDVNKADLVKSSCVFFLQHELKLFELV